MKLNPCPECCSTAVLHPVTQRVGQTFYLVVCQSCGAGPNKAFASENLAIAQWNAFKLRNKSVKSIANPLSNAVPKSICEIA